jgi:uncharacterized phage infection (PIP) family protein YhgE
MKTLHTLLIVIGVASTAHAQLVVTDPISDVLDQIMHVEDIAKTVEMINNQVQQINALTQQLQQIQAYVKAFGDPEQLLSIVGVDGLIDSLNTSGVGQTLGELRSLASGVEALRDNANGLYQSIGETFTTPGGYELPRAEELYRKFAASQRVTRNFESVYDDVSQRRGVLKGRIAETTQQLQASTTDAETQKLTGVITGYNAELAAIDKEVDGALAESLVLDIQNREDREKQEQARKEERMAEFSEAMSNYSKTFRIDDAPPAFPTR